MTIDEIEYIKKCVNQNHISCSNKAKIMEILDNEKEHIDWLKMFMPKEVNNIESRTKKIQW